MKTPLFHHLKQIHNNPCINEDLRLQSSLSHKVTNRAEIFQSPRSHEHSKVKLQVGKNKMKFKNLSPENQ